MAIRRVDIVSEFHTEYARVKDWLLEALDRQIGETDEKRLLSGLGTGKYVLWTSENAACVTEKCTVDGVTVCLLYLVAGKHHSALDEVLGDGQSVVEQWAKENGCKGFYGVGRAEWKRVLAPHGFEAVSVNFYKEFKDVQFT